MRVTIRQRPPDAVDEDRGILLEDLGLARLSRKVRIALENLLGVQEGQLLGKLGVLRISQLGKGLVQEDLGPLERGPDPLDDRREEVEISVAVGDHPLPVPLIDVGTVVVIQKVVLAHRPHVGQDPLADLHAELP